MSYDSAEGSRPGSERRKNEKHRSQFFVSTGVFHTERRKSTVSHDTARSHTEADSITFWAPPTSFTRSSPIISTCRRRLLKGNII
ncbi:hypothetical protein EYF80_005897 [Liparis tanakae]|uniref:Uncharacterized protein n=1 Tax=Liparis tanakae TaxID=230148 RepID=A0A4Z2J196_9TELE|nr:hypothetical protein EYF80_005897 [Liparis tanakae]